MFAHGGVTSPFSWDQRKSISDTALLPCQDFSLFHLLVFDSLCEPSVLQNSLASQRGRSSLQQRCSLMLGERPPSTFFTFYVVCSDTLDTQASTSTSPTAAPVLAPSLHANFPLHAPVGGHEVDSGGGEQPTPTPNSIFPSNILFIAADVDASPAVVPTPLALAPLPPATPMQHKDDDDPLQTLTFKPRCSPPKLVVTPFQQQNGGVASASGSTAAASASGGDKFIVSCQPGGVSRAPPRPRWRWRRESPSAEGCQAAPLHEKCNHLQVGARNCYCLQSRQAQALAPPPPKQATPCKACCVAGGWWALTHGGATHSAIRPSRRTRCLIASE